MLPMLLSYIDENITMSSEAVFITSVEAELMKLTSPAIKGRVG